MRPSSAIEKRSWFVATLPSARASPERVDVLTVVARPELFLVHPMVAFRLAVLARDAAANAADVDAELMTRQCEEERKVNPVTD